MRVQRAGDGVAVPLIGYFLDPIPAVRSPQSRIQTRHVALESLENTPPHQRRALGQLSVSKTHRGVFARGNGYS